MIKRNIRRFLDLLYRRSPCIGWVTSEMKRAPFKGLQFILYLCVRTDLVQPIKRSEALILRIEPIK